MQMLGFSFSGRGWLRLELFGGAVFWCGWCFVEFGGIPLKRGKKTSSVLYRGKGLTNSGNDGVIGAHPPPQGVHTGRSNLHQGEDMSSPGPEALEKAQMAGHRWELWDGGSIPPGRGKGPWAALLPTHLFSRQEFHRLPNDVLGSSLLLMSS